MLNVKNLVKIYKPKKGNPVTALNNVSIDFAEKGLVFLLGKSGSGKSTLLNVIGGLDSYTSGEIIIKGKSSSEFKQSDFDSYRNTFIGFIFQEFNILEDYTVGKNIGLALELQSKPADQTAINELLKQVDLEGYATRKPNELSGGQKQRIAIARALIKNPEIIMADEPTGALDSKTGKQVFETLKNLAKTKLVIVVSHDKENAEIYGDRVVELKDGIIISDRKRTELSGELVEQKPVNIVGDDLIQIKSKHKLSQKDVNEINEFLAKSNDDVFISASAKKNEMFIEELSKNQKYTTKFENTTKENNPIKTYDGKDFKLVKSRLPFKDSFKMGVSGLKHKKVRLIFTILLSLVAFTMFGISVVAAQFNSIATQAKTLYDSGTRTIIVKSVTAEKNNGGYFGIYEAPGISASQIDYIKSATGGKVMKLANTPDTYGDVIVSLSNHFARQTTIAENLPYYATEINNLVEIEAAGDANLVDATSNKSRMPTNYDEIAITDYLAESFLKNGFKDINTNAEKTINSYEDLIGLELQYKSNYPRTMLKIVGIYKTDIDLSDFEKVKDTTPDRNMIESLKYSGIKQTIASMGIVAKGFIESKSHLSSNSLNMSNSNYGLTVAGIESEYASNYISSLTKFTSAMNQVYWHKDGAPKTELANDEIIIRADYFNSSSSYMQYETLKGVFNEVENPTAVIARKNGGADSKTYKVVGIVDYSAYVLTNDIVFEEYKQLISAPMAVMINLTGDYGKDYKILNKLSTVIQEGNYLNKVIPVTIFSPIYDNVESILFILKDVFMWMAVVFSIFAGFLLMNFISVSISIKRKDIGVLRAIGARSLDVFKIFYSESLVVGLINLILTYITVFILCTVLNSVMGISFLIMGIVPILLMAGLALLVTVLATYLPVHKFARKKPVDTINNR